MTEGKGLGQRQKIQVQWNYIFVSL